MATQYTTILKLALPTQGELSGTWGDVVNDNITEMVEEAVAGRKVINTWTTNSHTLTTADGTTSESRAAILTLTDTGTALTGAGTVICPANSKVYIVENSTGQTITVKTSAGTGVAITNNSNTVVFCDGTNVQSATGASTLADTLSAGNTTGGTDIAVGTGDDITFADSSKAIFGAGSDLQIYHDGSNSYIQENGTGDLLIGASNFQLKSGDYGESMLTATDDGAVTLFYNNASKLATNNDGIDVTGTIVHDGLRNENTGVTATSKTLTDGENVTVTAATQTITLPASPAAGDEVHISVGDFTDTVVGRNSSNIMGLAEDLTLDVANIGVTLVYSGNATQGWRLF